MLADGIRDGIPGGIPGGIRDGTRDGIPDRIPGGMLLSNAFLRQLSVARPKKRQNPHELAIGHAQTFSLCVW